MARMLGKVNQPWCPICKSPPGLDCPVIGERGKRAQRHRERDEDDQVVRAYVSRLWAEDWDSDEDAVYDHPGR